MFLAEVVLSVVDIVIWLQILSKMIEEYKMEISGAS
jgi:hypothetical protein